MHELLRVLHKQVAAQMAAVEPTTMTTEDFIAFHEPLLAEHMAVQKSIHLAKQNKSVWQPEDNALAQTVYGMFKAKQSSTAASMEIIRTRSATMMKLRLEQTSPTERTDGITQPRVAAPPAIANAPIGPFVPESSAFPSTQPPSVKGTDSHSQPANILSASMIVSSAKPAIRKFSKQGRPRNPIFQSAIATTEETDDDGLSTLTSELSMF